jgi:hypothetical protein
MWYTSASVAWKETCRIESRTKPSKESSIGYHFCANQPIRRLSADCMLITTSINAMRSGSSEIQVAGRVSHGKPRKECSKRVAGYDNHPFHLSRCKIRNHAETDTANSTPKGHPIPTWPSSGSSPECYPNHPQAPRNNELGNSRNADCDTL